MTKEQFDKFKKIIQREIKIDNLNNHEYTFMDNMLGEIRRELVEKPDTFRVHKDMINYPSDEKW